MKKTYLLFVSLISAMISRPAFSQLHVVKDNIKCAYGLKDTNQAWVVNPVYVEIRELVFMANSRGTHEGFEVFDGRYHGVLSASGKIVVPISQDYIMAYSTGYIGVKNKKACIFDTAGKALCEQVYDQIKPYRYSADYYWCYKESQGSALTSLIEISHGFLFKDVPGYVREWTDSTYTIFQKNEQYYVNPYSADNLKLPPEFGVIDTNGTIILPRIYNEIWIRKKHFAVRKDQTYLIVNSKNELIAGPFSSLKKAKTTQERGPWIAMKEDSTCSLISDDLQTIVPFNTYDKIGLISEYRDLYRVVKDKKTGLMDSTGKLIIPLLYDEIIRGSEAYGTYICKSKGRFGIINSKGEIVLKANYDLMKSGSDYLRFLIGNDALYAIPVNDTIRKLAFLFRNSFGDFYKSRYYTVLIKRDDTGRPTDLFCNGLQESLSLGSYENLLWFRNRLPGIPDDLHVFTASGIGLFPDKVRDVFPHDSTHLLSLETKSRHFGVASSASGTMVLDTTYTAIHITPDKPGTVLIWGRSKKGYQVFDRYGTSCVSTVFDSIPCKTGNENYFSGSSNGKKGLLDRDLGWIIAPAYEEVQAISDKLSYVITKGGHIGIRDHSNRLVIDTAYTDFTPVFSNIHECLFANSDTINDFTAAKKQLWWLLSGHDNRALFNDRGECILSGSASDPHSALIDSLLFQFAFKGELFDCNREEETYYHTFIKADGSHNIAEGAFKITLTKKEKELLRSRPFVKEICAILKRSYQEECANLHYANTDPLFPVSAQKGHLPDTFIYKGLNHFGENFVSLGYCEATPSAYNALNVHWVNYNYSDPFYENYLLRSGKLHKTEISDVFGSGNLLQEELLLAISKNDSLALDCSSPEGLVKKAQGHLSLSEKGISVYFRDSDYLLAEVVIPIERLKAHPETAWIIPYLK